MGRPRPEPCGLLSVFVFLCALSVGAQPVLDEAVDFTVADEVINIIPASNPQQTEVSSNFGGDATRFTRKESGPGSLTYREEQGINEVSIDVFALISLEAGEWTLTVTVGSKDVVELTAVELQEAFSAATVRTLHPPSVACITQNIWCPESEYAVQCTIDCPVAQSASQLVGNYARRPTDPYGSNT